MVIELDERSGVSMSGLVDRDDTIPNRHGRDWRVCVIGNSYTGAVKRAYAIGPMEGYTLNFFANPGRHFTDLRLEGRRITNAPFSDGGSIHVDDYDAFVVYGDAPTAAEVMALMEKIQTASYSRQVREATLRDRLLQSHAYRICGQLLKLQGVPIFLLSRNYSANELRGDAYAIKQSEALLAQALRPVSFIPFPEELFGHDGKPLPDFHVGSLNVDGVEPDRVEQPEHHLYHLNQQGGAHVLAAIVQSLSTVLPSAHARG